MKTSVQAEIPQKLLSEAQSFVEEGWATNFDELLTEALRRYLESHTAHITETLIREDVAWGLRGKD